ncbi:hypothetical protein K523DRAFT_371500 [Schizophyllum commune Tattone D]|nr:hypothetical protein K523DRAFT_371500 [Schizophyllum commune Tattone D]
MSSHPPSTASSLPGHSPAIDMNLLTDGTPCSASFDVTSAKRDLRPMHGSKHREGASCFQGRDLPPPSQAAPTLRLHSPRFPLPHASCYASPARRRARLALTARGRRRLLYIDAER